MAIVWLLSANVLDALETRLAGVTRLPTAYRLRRLLCCYRQILQLVQNGADATLEGHEQGISPADGNRIHVFLRESHLYVANRGAPLREEGLDALPRSHSSPKRGNQIGRFGLGFKSLLKLEGRIDLFTRASAERTLSILKRHGRVAQVIGNAVSDPQKIVRIPARGLAGQHKRFWREDGVARRARDYTPGSFGPYV